MNASGFVFDRARAIEIGTALLGAMSAANPEVKAASEALAALVSLKQMFRRIQQDDPSAWADISASFSADLQAWLDA